jgi:DNA-binding winged helix-turn-helix (wHTH) protein/TolB-like protein
MRFAEFELTADGDLLRSGERVHLQPQPLKVLGLLVSRAGELVSREELQKHVWNDGTFIDFDQGLNWCIRRIREVLGDDAAAPRFIQTVPRRGYRFIGSIHQRQRRWPAIAASLLLALLVSFSAPARVSVLVLPFDNLGGALRADEVATAEIIGSLAEIDPARLAVIDPMTARKFKDTKECIIELGKQLDTQYVMVGAVRQRGERLRVIAQLFRVADNRQAWAAAEELPLGSDPAPAYARMAGRVAATLGIQSKFNRFSID